MSPKFSSINFTQNIDYQTMEELVDNYENEIELQFEPSSYTEGVVKVDAEKDEVSFSYLSHDETPEEYDFSEGVVFETFNDMRSKMERMKELRKEGYKVFPVEEYRHSGSVFAFEGQGNFPDRQWDVLPNSLIALDKDWTNQKKSAQSIIEDYNNYVSGQVYGICHETYTLSTGELKEEEACWGYIGSDYAEETLITEHGSPEQKKSLFLEKITPLLGRNGKLTDGGGYHLLKKGDGIEEIQKHLETYYKGVDVNKDELDEIVKSKFKSSSTKKNRP